VLNRKAISGELKMIQMEAAVAYFEVLSRNFPGWTEKNHEKSVRISMSRKTLEPSTTCICTRNVTARANLFGEHSVLVLKAYTSPKAITFHLRLRLSRFFPTGVSLKVSVVISNCFHVCFMPRSYILFDFMKGKKENSLAFTGKQVSLSCYSTT
jgi:hypothetical protein